MTLPGNVLPWKKRMRVFSLLISTICFVATARAQTYVGSTPAHNVIRNFLQISLTDSIDFIRWKLETDAGVFKLQCQYGLSKPSTPGFSNEQRVSMEGRLTKSKNYCYLENKGRKISMLRVNVNVLHFLDSDNHMLAGNGGYSYALNNTGPVVGDVANTLPIQDKIKSPQVFEGRTPCQQLSAQLGLNKGAACDKMKWYFLFYTDSVTGKPSYYLMGGMGYRKETMARGRWEIVPQQQGRIIYRIYSDKWSHPLNLLKGDDNILFFLDNAGRLLVGNENFSYTLNRRQEEYQPVKR